MIRHRFLLLTFSAVALLVSSCSKAAAGGSASLMAVPQEEGAVSTRMSAKLAYADAEDDMAEAVYEESSLADNGGSIIQEGLPRKLIKTGYLQIEVSSLADTELAIRGWCDSLGGYIESSYAGETNGGMTLRIPSQSFDAAMNSAGDFGTVKSKNISSQDVTESFYDLQTRLETKKVMRERLQGYLQNAKDIKDMLQIEKELNSVISDTESMEGRIKRLSGQIDYSQLNISYSLPFRADDDHSFVLPDFGDGFRRFISNVLDFFIGFIKILFYIVIFGIPVIAAVAFFYWLLLGKAGLLKKLFKKLSGK